MRLLTFRVNDSHRLGALVREEVVDLNLAYAAARGMTPAEAASVLPAEMVAFLEKGGLALQAAQQALAFMEERWDERTGPLAYKPGQVRILAPIPRPPKIICVGRNYADHVAEGGKLLTMPEVPSFFAKFPCCVIGPGAPIVRPRGVQQLDYEGELAFVIGRRGKEIPLQKALDYLAGYTIFNDASARDFQFKDPHVTRAKNFDTAAPMGPYLVTKDEVPDPHNLALRTRVNGELRQESNTKHFVFNIPTMVSFLSQGLTLEPGDVVSTGTPSGVGVFRHPPVFLNPGDVVAIEIEGLGILENPVVAAP